MRSDLTQTFIDELSRNGRKPVQFLVFHFSSGYVYVGDGAFSGNSSFLPIVESWGNIQDAVNTTAMINGEGLPTRSATVVLLNIGVEPFSFRFFDDAPENTEVSFYQTFNFESGGIDINNAVLIDKFRIQDPIQFNESNGLLSLDFVSSNQYADPIVGTIDTVNNEYYGVVLGAISGVAGTPYNAHPIAALTADITATQTTITTDTDLMSVGFQYAGVAIIDYELVIYTSVSGTSFLGCTRGYAAGATRSAAFPHSSGTTITRLGYEYLFAFGQGPLDAIGPVYADGVLYSGAVNLYPTRNPVQVGFMEGFPFEKVTGDIVVDVDGNTPTTITLSLSECYVDTSDPTHSNFLDCAVSVFKIRTNGTDTSTSLPKATYSLSGFSLITDSLTNFAEFESGTQELTAWAYAYSGSLGTTSAVAKVNGTTIATATSTSNPNSGVEGDYSRDLNSWSDCLSTEVVSLEISAAGWNAPNFPTTYIGGIRCSYKDISYRPYKREFYSAVTCNISSGTGNTNPSDAIQAMFAKIGVSSNIDSASFATTKAWFTANSYSFNGFIPGDARTRETIKDMCQQSRSYLVFNRGKIFHYIRQHLADQTKKGQFLPSDLVLKSISIIRQNASDILNDITVRYDAIDVQADYQNSYQVTIQDSIDKFGLQDTVYDYYLVSSASMIADVADFWIDETRTPATIISFDTYLDAFIYEIGDVVLLKSQFNKLYAFKGDIVNIQRTFGSGKNKKINLFTITIKANFYSLVEKSVTDSFSFVENVLIGMDYEKEIISSFGFFESVDVQRAFVSLLNDNVGFVEDLTTQIIAVSGYGASGYGTVKYGD